MAKTTSKTQAKTKTTNKKPTVKAAAKTAKTSSAKAVRKPATKAAAKTTKTTKSTIKPAELPKQNAKVTTNGVAPLLNRAQVQLGILFALLAGAAGYFMSTTSVQVLFGHLTKDELASMSGTVLAPAAHVLYEVEFRWLVVGFLALAAVLAFLRGTKYLAAETASTKNKVQPLRWVDYALTGSVMFSIAALMNGVQDLIALKLSAVSIIVAAYLGWVFERENAVTGKATRSIYAVSAVLTVLPVLFLLATMIGTTVYGTDGAGVSVRSPWYAYAAAAIASLSLLVATRMQWSAFKNKYEYAFTSKRFARLAVVSKIAFAAVLVIGLMRDL